MHVQVQVRYRSECGVLALSNAIKFTVQIITNCQLYLVCAGQQQQQQQKRCNIQKKAAWRGIFFLKLNCSRAVRP